MAELEYEHRIVCFIDILAFKNIINKTIDKDGNDLIEEIKAVNEALLLVREFLDIEKEFDTTVSKVVTQFSDSIVISFLVNEPSQVFYTLHGILLLIMNFMYRGILVRGGISYGKLIHNDKILFGPGMITAYETESKAALYPRVILDKTVLEIAKMFHAEGSDPESEEESILSIVTKDTDDMYYIDYIQKAESELDLPEYEMPTYISNLRKVIEKNMEFDAPDIKVKTGWLINKFNLLIESATNVEFIEKLKASGEVELADYYSKLKKIE